MNELLGAVGQGREKAVVIGEGDMRMPPRRGFVLYVMLLAGMAAAECACASLSVDYAYFRRMVPKERPPQQRYAYGKQEPEDYDPGTVHLFLRNDGDKPVRVTQVAVNDVALPAEFLCPELKKLEELALPEFDGLGDTSGTAPTPAESEWREVKVPSARFIWYQALPNPVPPGKVSDVMVKFATCAKRLIKIAAKTSDGQELSRVVQPQPSPFRMTFVGFSDAYDKLYVYLQNDSTKPLTIGRMWLDTTDVTAKSAIPDPVTAPGAKTCVVITPDMTLSRGQYVAVKVESRESDLVAAVAVLPVWNHFPVSSWDGDTRASRFCDPDLCRTNTCDRSIPNTCSIVNRCTVQNRCGTDICSLYDSCSGPGNPTNLCSWNSCVTSNTCAPIDECSPLDVCNVNTCGAGGGTNSTDHCSTNECSLDTCSGLIDDDCSYDTCSYNECRASTNDICDTDWCDVNTCDYDHCRRDLCATNLCGINTCVPFHNSGCMGND